jgi:hypothetical protein
MASTMLSIPPEDYGWLKDVAAVQFCVTDLPSDGTKEDQIKARLRELTEDSRRLRGELEQLIRYDPHRQLSQAHDRAVRRIRTADRRRKPR